MRKGLGLGLFGAFLAVVVSPQLAKADAPIPTDGLAEGSGHWVTARYELDCKAENRLFVDATVHTRIVDGSGKEDCKGEKLEISNRSSKPFHYGIAGSVIATVASGGVVTIFVPRPSNPEADTRVPLTGRHFSDCGVGKMWKNGTCKDWEDPCPAGDSRADITDLWQAQGEDYSLSAIQWRIMNECFDEKGKFDNDDAECKTEVKRCEDQRSQISSNQHDHSTVQDLALSDMRKQYLGQTYTVRDPKIFEEPDAQISCQAMSRETMKKRSNDRHAIGERHWRVANEYSNWLIWKQQVNRECSIKNNQAPKQIATFTPRKYQEPTYGPGSGRKHGITSPTPDSTRSNGQSLNKNDDKDKDDRDRRRHTFEHHNDGPPLKAQPMEQNLNKNGPGQSPSPSTTSRSEPSRTQPPTSTNTPAPREGGHEQHQNTPKLPGQPLDQNLGKTGPQSTPMTPNGPNGTRVVPLGVQAPPSVGTSPSRTNPPTIADLGKKMEEERREREQRTQPNALQARERADRERADADRQRNERERADRERLNQQSQQNDRMRADRERADRERQNQQSQQNDRMRADRERADRERADRERSERASREADQRRDEQRRQLEQQQRQAQDDRRRQQMEDQRRQQADESRRQREDAARQQREEDRRRQAQEESRRQQEESRRQSQQRMQPSTSFRRR